MLTNAGYIIISEELLNEILDFKGATIKYIGVDAIDKTISILLTHPDLPEISETGLIPVIKTVYSATYGENGVVTKLERTNPPKKG